MAKLTPEERRQNLAAFHATIRGKPKPKKFVLASVAGQTGKLKSPTERYVYESLIEVGYQPIIGYQFDRFLIDLAFPHVKLAIEVDGGNWHTSPRKAKQDLRKTALLERDGWLVLHIRLDEGSSFAPEVGKLIAQIERSGRNP
jgi:hypothetical protein